MKDVRASTFRVPGLVGGQPIRRLVVVLGDQLDERAGALHDFDSNADAIFMAEVRGESRISTKMRTALFLAAMRHFAQQQVDSGRRVAYVRLDDPDNCHDLLGEIVRATTMLRPQRVVMVEPGEWRLRDGVTRLALPCPVEMRDDRRLSLIHI